MDENELKLIAELSKNSQASQRYLSKALDLSLGMVNIILHRLIAKGYMKAKQLDGRRVSYILTPKGFSEKVKRSSEYIARTIDAFTSIKERIKDKIKGLYDNGHRKFVILGEGEPAALTGMALKELDLMDAEYELRTALDKPEDGTAVIRVEDLYRELAKEL